MNRKRGLSNCFSALLGCLVGMFAWPGAAAQSPQPPASEGASRTIGSELVPLVPFSCVTVRAGDRVSLDWYPGFDHEAIVAGINSFRLSFSPIVENNNTPVSRPVVMLGERGLMGVAKSTWNGYFHVELPVPRSIRPGAYSLTDARAIAATLPEYNRIFHLQMTNSPVQSGFCITVAATQPSSQQQSNSDVP